MHESIAAGSDPSIFSGAMKRKEPFYKNLGLRNTASLGLL